MKTRKQISITTLVCVVTIGFCAGCNAVKATQGTDTRPDDAALSASVKTSYSQDLSLRGDPIMVSTTDGVVSLSGSVSSQDERDRAVAIARSVPGVQSVYDDLAIK